MTTKVHQFTIEGEPASKANSRKIVTIKGRPVSIKSDKARNYTAAFSQQCKKLDELFECEVSIAKTVLGLDIFIRIMQL